MGFQERVGWQLRHYCGYKKLRSGNGDDEKLRIRWRSRRMWLKKMNGGLKGIRLSRRKLTFKAFSATFLPSGRIRIAKLCAHIIERIKLDDAQQYIHRAYPSFIFSTPWGLPVLSHPHPTLVKYTSRCSLFGQI